MAISASAYTMTATDVPPVTGEWIDVSTFNKIRFAGLDMSNPERCFFNVRLSVDGTDLTTINLFGGISPGVLSPVVDLKNDTYFGYRFVQFVFNRVVYEGEPVEEASGTILLLGE